MKFMVHVFVLPHDDLRDPQGAAVQDAMQRLGLKADRVRVGKTIRFQLEAQDRAQAEAQVQDISKKLLSNPVIERFWFKVEEGEG